MLWLIVILVSYLLFAAVFLIDKYLLVSHVPNPKVYAFYIGVLGVAVLPVIPFVDFYILEPLQLLLAFISGASFVLAIYWFFKGLKIFESSRMVPAVGGILPIFTFLLIYFFSAGKELLNFWEIIAFLLLILGSFLITYNKSKNISLESLKLSAVAAFFFAIYFVFSKYVYLKYPFLLGMIWIRLGGVLMASVFLFNHQFRAEIFKKDMGPQRKTAVIFFSGQMGGAAAGILQNWAIALAPLAYLAFINALQGVQYVFLLVLAAFFSLKFPKLLKEEISREAIFQKIVAILFIGIGLLVLALK